MDLNWSIGLFFIDSASRAPCDAMLVVSITLWNCTLGEKLLFVNESQPHTGHVTDNTESWAFPKCPKKLLREKTFFVLKATCWSDPKYSTRPNNYLFVKWKTNTQHVRVLVTAHWANVYEVDSHWRLNQGRDQLPLDLRFRSTWKQGKHESLK